MNSYALTGLKIQILKSKVEEALKSGNMTLALDTLLEIKNLETERVKYAVIKSQYKKGEL
ncbi:hypothetical protein [Pseudomonas putida]|uniref:hypothetical protein n=1 Tax=Pseudomonas putida TaxID=303 RepID=UPI000AA9CE96|nr:hypothetical protein [Pseudomonas putida]